MEKHVCSVLGCGRKHYGKSVCAMHYQRLRNRGTTAEPPKRGGTPEQLAEARAARRPIMKVTCGHSGRKHYARGLCASCYSTTYFPATNWQRQNPERARAHR